MGLDMYLYAGKYLSNYDFAPEDRAVAKAVRETIGFPIEFPHQGSEGAVDLKITIGYWRKVNAVHNWFVHNVQGGEDECEEYYVKREQLSALRELCTTLLQTKDESQVLEKLPPTQGFFFGSTDIDEYFWSDLEETVEILNKALTLDEQGWYIYYRSSW